MARSMRLALEAGILLLLGAAHAVARTWYIKADGTGDAPTIQAGIDSASIGDSVVLRCGTYHECGLTMKPDIALSGESAECVTIDGQRGGRLMSCVDVGSGTVIEGITFSGGSVLDCGAGIYVGGFSSPSIRNCTFTGCYASGSRDVFGRAGGMGCEGASPEVSRCTFVGNVAGYMGEIFLHTSGGGGVYCGDGGHPAFMDCSFTQNSTEAQVGSGGGVCSLTEATFIRCTFVGNVADHGGQGGGAYFGCPQTFEACVVAGNRAQFGGGVCHEGYGGGTAPYRSSTFANNQAESGSGILLRGNNTLTMDDLIICGGTGGSAIEISTMPVLSCCDIIGNAGGDWVGGIENQLGVRGNISEWPLFCNPLGGDYHLSAGSPCLPKNNLCEQLVGALGQGCGAVAIEPQTWGSLKSLYR